MKIRLHAIAILLPSLLACTLSCGRAGAQELLDPAVAFKFSARALDASTLEVRYQIADGYYLYRNKFKFEAVPAEFKLGDAQFPKGEIHKDEFFGEVETYRRQLSIRLPLARDAQAGKLKLAVTSQGCADVGVCYIPQVQSVEIRLAAFTGPLMSSAPPRASTPLSDALAGNNAPAAPTAPGLVGDEVRFENLLASGSLWLIAA